MNQEEVKKLLEEVDKAAEDARWISRDDDLAIKDAMAVHGAHAYGASTATWKLLVVSFSTEYQGFPPGSKGYDGTAASDKGAVMRLPRELAEKLYKQAETQKGVPRP
jgi:hypothetical protein